MSDLPEPKMRAGHAEKDATLEVLSNAFAQGQLELDEYHERQSACLSAKYTDELARLTADLTAAPSVPARAHSASGAPWAVAFLSGKEIQLSQDRPTVRSFAFWGGNDIYVAGAMGPGVRLELTVTSIMGGHDVYVPPGVRVIDETTSFMGGVDINRDARGDGSNGTLVLRGFNLMGGSEVQLES